MCVKAMNDTFWLEGFVPSTLVFGIHSSTHLFKEPRELKPTLQERGTLANTVRLEMDKHRVSLHVNRALRHKVPPAAKIVFEVGDQVLVFREKQVNNRIGEWLGPYIVRGVNMSRKIVYVQLKENDQPKTFGLAQVKKFLWHDDLNIGFVADLGNALRLFSTDNNNDNESSKFATEVLRKGDPPRINKDEMVAAKKNEVQVLLERETFKVAAKTEIPPDANVLPARFVLDVKIDDGHKVYNARIVNGEHSGFIKNLIVHSSHNIQPATIRLMLFMAAARDFETWTADVRQAYLQSDEPILPPVLIKNSVP